MISEILRYACVAGLLTWVVCVFVACALVRADLVDMADRDREQDGRE